MKIKILWHCNQIISRELLADLGLSPDDLLQPSLSCALLRQISKDDIILLETLQCTNKIMQPKADTYLYLFDHTKLEQHIRAQNGKSLETLPNILNELRMRTRALSYQYPESAGMYHIDLSYPRVMAIVNVTPDSFSDGGRYVSPEAAYRHAVQLIADGADILDIGGESSRPGAKPVPENEELSRVIPLIRQIRKESDTLISVDTYKSAVAEQALDAGANWINDISGLRYDPEMVHVVKKWECPVIVMHMLGNPQTMQIDPRYTNVISQLLDFFYERVEYLKESGIIKLILDPGIGFGKRLQDNIHILRHLHLFKQFGFPVLSGTSRKSFIGQITGRDVNQRDEGTLASIAVAVRNGAAIIRTHEVQGARDAIKIIHTIFH